MKLARPAHSSRSAAPLVAALLTAALGAGPAFAASKTVTTLADSGAGSLRDALTYAQTNSGTSIQFNLPANLAVGGVFTIKPHSPLPVVSGASTTINGFTQPGNTNPDGPEIVINGAMAGAGANGLQLTAGTGLVKGLVINGFSGDGILVTGAGAGSSAVKGCYLGTNAAGNGAVSNGANGIEITGQAHDNAVGSPSAGEGNLISGNGKNGVDIGGATKTLVQGNRIGTDRTGSSALGNAKRGILVHGTAPTNTIGGTAAGAGNTISGNAGAGIVITDAGSQGNLVQGNRIGTDAAGSAALANKAGGIWVQAGAKNTTIGGAGAGARNLVSGNTGDAITVAGSTTTGVQVQGNYVGVNTAGTAAIPNSGSGVMLVQVPGVTAFQNLASGNGLHGVVVHGAAAIGNIVQGNTIGTNAAGSTAVPNASVGILVQVGAQTNKLLGNLVSGNKSAGIAVQGAGTNGNVVQGNKVGLTAGGAAPLPNWTGITIQKGSQNNQVGGDQAAQRNVVSGNTSAQVVLAESQTSGNVILGNYLGTDVTGSVTVGDGSADGIEVYGGASNNQIGGYLQAGHNVIAGQHYGVHVTGSTTSGNYVQGNWVGLAADGVTPLGNQCGIVLSEGANATRVGGNLGAGEGNVIAASQSFGILLAGDGLGTTHFNMVLGNFVGTDAVSGNHLDCGNWVGICVSGPCQANFIGDGNDYHANLILHNKGDGIQIGAAGIGMPVLTCIRRNMIDENGGLGINLRPTGEADQKVTLNDSGDADGGPNHLQNFPKLTSVLVTSKNGAYTTTVVGTLDCQPSQKYAIDLYYSQTADASGYGEGRSFFGTVSVTTNAQGHAAFTLAVPQWHTGQSFSATATALGWISGETSEFSKSVTALAVIQFPGP